jgi:hypothetical protein
MSNDFSPDPGGDSLTEATTTGWLQPPRHFLPVRS